jgi:hypothetical protein
MKDKSYRGISKRDKELMLSGTALEFLRMGKEAFV